MSNPINYRATIYLRSNEEHMKYFLEYRHEDAETLPESQDIQDIKDEIISWLDDLGFGVTCIVSRGDGPQT